MRWGELCIMIEMEYTVILSIDLPLPASHRVHKTDITLIICYYDGHNLSELHKITKTGLRPQKMEQKDYDVTKNDNEMNYSLTNNIMFL